MKMGHLWHTLPRRRKVRTLCKDQQESYRGLIDMYPLGHRGGTEDFRRGSFTAQMITFDSTMHTEAPIGCLMNYIIGRSISREAYRNIFRRRCVAHVWHLSSSEIHGGREKTTRSTRSASSSSKRSVGTTSRCCTGSSSSPPSNASPSRIRKRW